MIYLCIILAMRRVIQPALLKWCAFLLPHSFSLDTPALPLFRLFPTASMIFDLCKFRCEAR